MLRTSPVVGSRCQRFHRNCLWTGMVALTMFVPALPAFGEDLPPLPERIDGWVESAAVGPIAPLCTDADFVRRIYLDLTGVIPTPEQARRFFDDPASDKRQRLIDELLESPSCTRHLTLWLDAVLMERRRDKAESIKPWIAYLFDSLAARKPLDQLFQQMITEDGSNADLRGATRFFLARDAEPHLMTRDLGRLAFGMDMQCAQCHDHPLIDDYHQADYYGLYAFVTRTSPFTDAKSKLTLLMEKADGEASYKSVFTQDSADGVRPQLPKGSTLFEEPKYEKGQEYQVAPAKDVRGVPKFSRRATLGAMLGGSREFRRNLANRLWALMLGRGLVHPVDFHGVGNPPTHPELLTLLGEEFAASGYQVRPILRAIALSRTYQRSVDAPRPDQVNFSDLAERVRQLEAAKATQAAAIEQLTAAAEEAAKNRQLAIEHNAAVTKELSPLETALITARAASEKAAADLKAAESDHESTRRQDAALTAAATKSGEVVALLKDDKVLAAAAAIIAERAREFPPRVEASKQRAAERAAARETANQQLAAAQKAYDAVATKLKTSAQLAELQNAELRARHLATEANFVQARLDRQIATAKTLRDYPEMAASDQAKADATWAELVDRWTIAGQLAPLKPLSPEQFATSAMQATGMLSGQVTSAAATIDKQPPDLLKNASEAEKPRIRSGLVELRLVDQLDGTFREFARLYGGQSSGDFQATVNQALYFGNSPSVDGWTKPSGENLAGRLVKQADPAQLADELYVSVLSRTATDAERTEVTAFLTERTADRAQAIGEMIWALLSSNEFRFNH